MIKQVLKNMNRVFSDGKYVGITTITFVIVFVTLYYFMVATVADNSLQISIMMSGAGYIFLTILSIFIIALLFGIYISLLVYKFSSNSLRGKSFFGAAGGFVGALGVGCPTCGAFLFGLFGAPLALMYLPFRGSELRVLGIILLALSVYFVAKSLNSGCKIKRKV